VVADAAALGASSALARADGLSGTTEAEALAGVEAAADGFAVDDGTTTEGATVGVGVVGVVVVGLVTSVQVFTDCMQSTWRKYSRAVLPIVLSTVLRPLPGTVTTMLGPSRATSASLTPSPSTRSRRMSTAWSSAAEDGCLPFSVFGSSVT
jgi:hypothetical protein